MRYHWVDISNPSIVQLPEELNNLRRCRPFKQAECSFCWTFPHAIGTLYVVLCSTLLRMHRACQHHQACAQCPMLHMVSESPVQRLKAMPCWVDCLWWCMCRVARAHAPACSAPWDPPAAWTPLKLCTWHTTTHQVGAQAPPVHLEGVSICLFCSDLRVFASATVFLCRDGRS